MQHTVSKRGFTLIEVLVASLLLGMLVTILTMVFNQSAIAWRTGKAGVSQLSLLRRQLSFAQKHSDNLLPRVDDTSRSRNGRVLSPWKENGTVRKRTLGNVESGLNFTVPTFSSQDDFSGGNGVVQPWQQVSGLASIRSGSSKTYIVGVLSYGPDGKKDTEDDITSWPEDVQ